jgi:hypothetical protein
VIPAWASWDDFVSELYDPDHLGEHWSAWINWYDHVVEGSPRSAQWEAAFTDLPGPRPWDDGPVAVNTEITRRLEQLSEPERLPEDRHEIDGGVLGTSPPDAPLPSPSPATRFAYIDGQFDVVPPTAWKSSGSQAAIYHARARELAVALADRLTKTDAVPDVAGSIGALINVLGDNVDQVQPDQLRLASRSISAKTRAYGHPAAQWKLSAESVSAFFELADVLVDLQAFVRNDLEAHENAIRELDLTTETAAEAKIALDLVTEGILASPEIVSERVELAFAAAAIVSNTAIDRQVKVAVEGDRTLSVTKPGSRRRARTRAFLGKIDSRRGFPWQHESDSRFLLGEGGQSWMGNHTRMIFANASLRRLKPVIPVRKLPSCTTYL